MSPELALMEAEVELVGWRGEAGVGVALSEASRCGNVEQSAWRRWASGGGQDGRRRQSMGEEGKMGDGGRAVLKASVRGRQADCSMLPHRDASDKAMTTPASPRLAATTKLTPTPDF
uniref:Uncharacterized protein n=1 Tax=Oryza nivara TaxID=4536 RepID=A0A0E0HKQ5_ORYNI